MSPYCTYCGQEIEESWNVCSNCGTRLKETPVPPTKPISRPTPPPSYQVQDYQQVYAKGEGSGFGVVSLICGIIGLLGSYIYGGPPFMTFPFFRILAVIFGGIGIKRDENIAPAVFGLILGIIGLTLYFGFYNLRRGY